MKLFNAIAATATGILLCGSLSPVSASQYSAEQVKNYLLTTSDGKAGLLSSCGAGRVFNRRGRSYWEPAHMNARAHIHTSFQAGEADAMRSFCPDVW